MSSVGSRKNKNTTTVFNRMGNDKTMCEGRNCMVKEDAVDPEKHGMMK